MANEKLEALAAKLRAKAKARRSKRKKKQAKRAGENFARKRRIERNDPEGVVETAKASAKQTQEVGSAFRDFFGETAPGRAAAAAQQQTKRAAEAAPDVDPPDEDPLSGFEADAFGEVDVNGDGRPDDVLVDFNDGGDRSQRRDDDPLDDLLI